jgi:XRE family aerobic/anaerobic benzoate catabolism transcriptional regulator
MESHAFLTELGRRLRAARLAAHKTVTEAADDAGVSRRHWTETEAGRANPSVLVLARQAEAARVSLAALVDQPWQLRRTERIALVGLRGAGKSTVGRLLAQGLEVPFVELDRRVEELAGLTLGELFELHGPDLFRRFEAEALERVLAEGERLVIATGGSIVASEETFERLRSTCRTVWLRARPEEHFRRVLEQGDRRPMGDNPRAMEELRAILERREPLYACCDLVLDTDDRTPAELVDTLLLAAGVEDLDRPYAMP